MAPTTNDTAKLSTVDAMKKGGFDKQPTYDNMAGKLLKQGAHPLIHGSMTNDQTPESLEKLYDGFAGEYDDAYDAMDYVSPRSVAQAAVDTLGTEKAATARILDAGCGTGKIGSHLRQIAGKDTFIHGVDLSAGMLEVAKNLGVYSQLGKANLMEKLSLDTHTYDAVVSTGVFTAGHVKKEAIEELSRVTRPGGFLIIGCQELVFESEGYVAYLETLKEKGVAQLDDILRSFTMKKAGTEMNILVIRVL